MNWQILPDKKQIAGYTTQKSQTEFAGRKWVAWFTTEVPIQDGPYKFSGLPGLIVEVADETGSHKMELKGLKKIKKQAEELNTQGKDIPLLRKKPIEVNRTQYVKQLKQHEKDPVQGMRELLSRPNTSVKINISGKEISDPAEVLRSMEQNARDEMSRNNNKIELIP